MTSAVLTGPAPAPVPDRSSHRQLPGSTAGAPARRWLRPGWPLVAIFVPFPLWWAMGLSEWICPIMAVPMALHLLRGRSISAPRGLGWWLLFLAWVTVGGALLQVDAYGAVADSSSTRFITWGYRLLWYVTITVVLMYVISTRKEFSTTRVTRVLGAMFVTVMLGGLLGVVAPYFEFRSLMEIVLPGSISHVQFVGKMIHPQAAELQQVLGYVSPRPSAPFAFTNTWGLNFAVTLPFFLYAWCGKDGGWRRMAAIPVLLVAAVPCIFSINRGMWGALVLMALFVAVRSAWTGRPAMLGGVLLAGLAVAVLLVVTPLGTVVADRFSNKGSEQGRTHLGTLTVESVARTSPLVGLGSTRDVQGNFQSITGGSTAQCPRCSPPALGTQGQLWLVVFSQGLVGLALFLVFFALVFLRHIRLRSPVATVSLAALVGVAVTLPVYNSLGVGLLVVMVAVGLLFREAERERLTKAPGLGSTLTTLGRYTSALRNSWAVVLVCVLLGVAVGGAWALLRPSPYTATQSVVLPKAPAYVDSGDGPMSIDTYGQLVASQRVLSAVASASHRSLEQVTAELGVTATPNTRVLHIRFTAPTPTAAQDGVEAGVNAFLTERQERLTAERDAELKDLNARTATLSQGVQMLDKALADAAARGAHDRSDDRVRVLGDRRSALLTQTHTVARQAVHVFAQGVDAGRATNAIRIIHTHDREKVALVSGCTGGFGVGAALAMLLNLAGPRLRRVRDVHDATGLPLLATVPYAPLDARTVDALVWARPTSYVAVDERDDVASGVAHTLSGLGSHVGGRSGAVVVASTRTRVDEVRDCCSRLALQGVDVRGIVLATRLGRHGERPGR
jgi:capsular polysaccharide biosynthesis protein